MKGPRLRFLVVLTLACLVLIPWTVLLGLTLPDEHTARRWPLTWVGFDVALIACLATTAWMAYRHRLAVVLWAMLTGTLLLCDAWFDITTATGDELAASILEAAVAEVPLAVFLFYGARRVLLRTARPGPPAERRRARLSAIPVAATTDERS
ncbi:hypothetical protein [Cryptosporangium phraense]|uniref:Uncharacterized protein n=1 Tax=Cryptosporangium phraense TaxID=2593070 RepID=A0A545ARX1_9ACTN|nr:hypothetical protein [Cryptosporangium phraense]TQS44003.1 hypothetical protein FL583_16235 [Cryptosporangium phraense]